MDSMPTTNQPVYTPPPGLFGSKIPASVAFVVGVLLFLLPISEIKCGGTTIMNKTGLNYALGKDWKPAGGLGNGLGSGANDMTTKTAGKKEGMAQYFAIAVLALGVIGILLSLAGSKSASGGGIVVGILAAGAAIAIMIEVKKWFNDSMAKEAADKATQGGDSLGLDKLGSSVKPTIGFTPWYYIAIVAFLAAAFFCYQRMRTARR